MTALSMTVLSAAVFTGCSLFDSEPPEISGVQIFYTVRCGQGADVDTSQFMSGVSAYDNVDGDVPVNMTFDRELNGMGKYTITYTAVDSKGNSSSKTSELVVNQPSEPVLGKWECSGNGKTAEIEFTDNLCYMSISGSSSIFSWEQYEHKDGKRIYFATTMDYSLGMIAIISDDNINVMSCSLIFDDDTVDLVFDYKE